MKLLRTVKTTIYKLTWVSEHATWGVLVTIVTVMAAGVIARYLLHSPFLFQIELVAALLVVFCALGFAPVFLQGGHIKVDLVTRHLSKRSQSCFLLAAELVTIAGTVLLFTSLLRLASLSLGIDARFSISGLPVAPFQIIFAVGFILLGLVVLVDFCERFYELLKGVRKS